MVRKSADGLCHQVSVQDMRPVSLIIINYGNRTGEEQINDTIYNIFTATGKMGSTEKKQLLEAFKC